jgi:tryptophan synthase beta chain
MPPTGGCGERLCSALAFACAQYGIDAEIWMVRASYDQKPHRRTLMQT